MERKKEGMEAVDKVQLKVLYCKIFMRSDYNIKWKRAMFYVVELYFIS